MPTQAAPHVAPRLEPRAAQLRATPAHSALTSSQAWRRRSGLRGVRACQLQQRRHCSRSTARGSQHGGRMGRCSASLCRPSTWWVATATGSARRRRQVHCTRGDPGNCQAERCCLFTTSTQRISRRLCVAPPLVCRGRQPLRWGSTSACGRLLGSRERRTAPVRLRCSPSPPAGCGTRARCRQHRRPPQAGVWRRPGGGTLGRRPAPSRGSLPPPATPHRRPPRPGTPLVWPPPRVRWGAGTRR